MAKIGYEEKELNSSWALGALFIALLGALVGVFLVWPIMQLIDPWIFQGSNFTRNYNIIAPFDFAAWKQYTGKIYFSFKTGVFSPQYFSFWFDAMKLRLQGHLGPNNIIAYAIIVIPFVLSFLIANIINPYSSALMLHGSAKIMDFTTFLKASLQDRTGLILGELPLKPFIGYRTTPLEKMADKRKAMVISFFLKWGIPVFFWYLIFTYKKQFVRNWEALSGLLLAPPGSGKSVMVKTNLLADWPDNATIPGPCFIVNDPKGELFNGTAPYRASIGPVFRLEWYQEDNKKAHSWNPIGLDTLKDGREFQKIKNEIMEVLNRFFDYEAAIKKYGEILTIARDASDNDEVSWDKIVANELIAKAKEKNLRFDRKQGETFCEKIQRLRGIISSREKYISRIVTIMIPNTGGDPHWANTGRTFLNGAIGYMISRCEREGKEPTMSAICDWISASKDKLDLSSAESEEKGEDDDLVAQILDEAIKECQEFGYPNRFRQDLQETRNKPDKERGSVISTATANIDIFKNEAVRARTRYNDFTLDDIRGINGKPISIYIVCPLEDAKAVSRVTGLFLEWVATATISIPEEKVTKKLRPVCMLLDEFWTLPPLEALMQIPALGRGVRVQVLIVGQATSQIVSAYKADGANALKTIVSATNYKIIPFQNDQETAEQFSKMIGNTTIEETSVSQTKGWGKGVNPLQRNESTSYRGEVLARPEAITSMEKIDPTKGQRGTQIVLVAGWANRPIVCTPSTWFNDLVLLKRGLWRKGERGFIFSLIINLYKTLLNIFFILPKSSYPYRLLEMLENNLYIRKPIKDINAILYNKKQT